MGLKTGQKKGINYMDKISMTDKKKKGALAPFLLV